MQFPNENNIATNKEYLHTILPIYEPLYIWNKLIKRELYINNDIWHPEGISLGEDLATTPRLILMANKIGKVNKAFVHYIVNPLSISRDQIGKKIYMLYEAQMIVDNYFKEKGVYDEYKRDLSDYLYFSMSYFLSRKAIKSDAEYEKSFNLTLKYFASKPPAPRTKKFRMWKRLVIKYLSLFPYRWNLKMIVFILANISVVKKQLTRRNF